jgi:succinyl-diaminopimelate desuccinylase
LFGRGVSDDKGPSLLILYALKELKDNKILPKRKIRFFVGCNEEDGWADLDYLKTKTTLPEYGFSPDGNFPLSYAEKGMYEITFTVPVSFSIKSIKGGTVVNAVCDYAQATVSDSFVEDGLIKKYGLSLKNDNVIESFGKAAHGSSPELGENALKPLFEYMHDLGEDLLPIVNAFNDTKNLSSLSSPQGNVTFSPDLIEEKDGKVFLTCDCRVPAPILTKSVEDVLDKYGFTYSTIEKHPTFMVEKDGFLVQTLIGAYNAVTGENAHPISMGGSTFARAFKFGCAFGPEFVGHDAKIHDANENLPESALLKYYEIYKTAIFAFAKN